MFPHTCKFREKSFSCGRIVSLDSMFSLGWGFINLCDISRQKMVQYIFCLKKFDLLLQNLGYACNLFWRSCNINSSFLSLLNDIFRDMIYIAFWVLPSLLYIYILHLAYAALLLTFSGHARPHGVSIWNLGGFGQRVVWSGSQMLWPQNWPNGCCQTHQKQEKVSEDTIHISGFFLRREIFAKVMLQPGGRGYLIFFSISPVFNISRVPNGDL